MTIGGFERDMRDGGGASTVAELAELASQQNGLLARLHEPGANAESPGMSAYRANAQANAFRALKGAYPVMAQLIGEENFAFLARDFRHAHPPTSGDLAQWGAHLADYVAQAPQLADLPFLPDVARIEWALHVCAGAADDTQDLQSFAALAETDPSAVWFKLAPGACALPSTYPAAAITLAHQGQGQLGAAFDLLTQGVAQTALVWRQAYAPRLRVLHAQEAAFVQALLAGKALGAALDEALAASPDEAMDETLDEGPVGAHASFDFSQWLAANVQNGFVLGIAANHPSRLPGLQTVDRAAEE